MEDAANRGNVEAQALGTVLKILLQAPQLARHEHAQIFVELSYT